MGGKDKLIPFIINSAKQTDGTKLVTKSYSIPKTPVKWYVKLLFKLVLLFTTYVLRLMNY